MESSYSVFAMAMEPHLTPRNPRRNTVGTCCGPMAHAPKLTHAVGFSFMRAASQPCCSPEVQFICSSPTAEHCRPQSECVVARRQSRSCAQVEMLKMASEVLGLEPDVGPPAWRDTYRPKA